VELSAIALRGLTQAQDQLESAAERLSPVKSASATGPPHDIADLSQAMADLLQGKDAFAANLKIVKVGDELERRTIDLLA